MGDPGIPTPDLREERRALARRIVESVIDDEEFPIDLKASTHSPEIVEGIVFGLAHELAMVAPEIDLLELDRELDDVDDANPRTRRLNILAATSDLVGEFVWYDRKEDEDLPRGAIQEAIANGETSVDEICAVFRAYLERGLTCE